MSISSVNSYGRFERDKYEYEDKYQADRCPIYICPLGDLNKYMFTYKHKYVSYERLE